MGPFINKVGITIRKKMYEEFLKYAQPSENNTVLDYGTTPDGERPQSNFFIKKYPFKNKIEAVSIEDCSDFTTKTGIRFLRIKPDSGLPYPDGAFDIGLSNAVIEHVGGYVKQQWYLKELCRVSRSIFLTTPDRSFPIEVHTLLPFIHYLPGKIYRRILRSIGKSYWAEESTLNLLTKRQLRLLFPQEYREKVQLKNIYFMGMPTNIIAYLMK